MDGIGLKDEAGPAAQPGKAQVTDFIKEIERRLEDVYGRPEIPQGNPLSILIGTILSQNTSDVNRDRAYTELWKAFRSYDEILESSITSLEAAIRSGGLARQKAIAIKNVLIWVKERYGNYDLSPICEEAPERAEKLLNKALNIQNLESKTTLRDSHRLLGEILMDDFNVFSSRVELNRLLIEFTTFKAQLEAQRTELMFLTRDN